jgi:Mrp family chromosome partitioning ATPase
MVDLTSEMAHLWAALRAPAKGHGRAIQFIGAHGGEGTSTVAREFARYAVGHLRKAVWLIDLDMIESPQNDIIAAESGRYGPLGRQTSASPDGSAFFTVQPPGRGADGRVISDAQFLIAYPVGSPRLWVTRFRRELLQPGQSVHILTKEDYWRALRRHADLIVVDSPAARRSSAGLTVAPLMDCSVLVVSADQRDSGGPVALKQSIAAAGGRCAGLMFNRAQAGPPAFLRRILPG